MKNKLNAWLPIILFCMVPTLSALQLDDQKMAAFFNERVPQLMEENNLAGLVICLVHNGGIVYSKGFGFSDIENRVNVDPAVTLFRAGSISKLFTWTAVMQLVEQDKIDLDEGY
jgi:CubicO group peptidase (beta-lactamase class C family)